MANKIKEVVGAGVITGEKVGTIFKIAKEEGFAIPAVNVVGTNSIISVLEAASAS